jgi:hypothetical protein
MKEIIMATQTSKFATELLARIPYSKNIIDNITKLNPKYETFEELTRRKVERLASQSVVFGQPNQPQHPLQGVQGTLGGIMQNNSFTEFMYANCDMNDKVRRLQDYRKMSSYSELSDAIDEICDDCIVYNTEDNSVIQFDMTGEHNREMKQEIAKEWRNFVQYLQLEDKGWEYFRQFLIDGEIFFENVISQTRPDYGILGLLSIPSELITPIFDNVQNDIIKGFMLRKPIKSQDPKTIEKEQIVLMEPQQITYVHSGIWNSDRTIRLPYIEAARRPYKQLSLIEDAIIIYRLVRAPERLIFNVEVGNMNAPQAESYLKRLMHSYWSKKTFDFSGNGGAQNAYNPQSMLDAFWFAKRNGQASTEVTTLPGGANLGQLDDLLFFQRKLYKSLKIPLSRMDPANVFSDGTTITREELKFASFVMRIQRNFAMGIKNSFVTHLKLRKLWHEYNLKETDVSIKFNTPTSFGVMREQQVFAIKLENFNNLSQNESISNTFCQRYYLGFNDAQIQENRAWLRNDSALQWELEQIRASGPNFQDSQDSMKQAEAEITGGGAGGAGGSGFSPEVPPDFGPGPEVAPAEAPAEAPAAGGAPAGAAPAGAAPTA